MGAHCLPWLWHTPFPMGSCAPTCPAGLASPCSSRPLCIPRDGSISLSLAVFFVGWEFPLPRAPGAGSRAQMHS